MNAKDRNKLRKKQDKIIKYAERHGTPEYYRVSPDYPDAPTITQLRNYIFPDWEFVFDQIIYDLKLK